MTYSRFFFSSRHALSCSAFLLCASYVEAKGQGCSGTPPPFGASQWADSGTKQLYVDPKLPATVQAQIRQAASDFAAQSGEPINVLAPGASDPGTSTQDAIRMMNDPSGSPSAFAHTAGQDVYTSSGTDTHQQISATTSWNLGYTLAPAQNGNPAIPAYDPNQTNANQFIYDSTLHELGHAFGINDVPPPTDPQTGQPDVPAETPGASIMNGYANTNDQGPHGAANGPAQPGGVGAKSVQPCDKQQMQQMNPPAGAPGGGGGSAGSGGGGGDGSSGGSSGDGGGGCSGYSDWNDSTNTVTYYYGC